MDPDAAQLLDAYLQRISALRNSPAEPPQPTIAELTSRVLQEWRPRSVGSGASGTTAGSNETQSPGLAGLYALGQTADLPPLLSAGGPDPYVQLTASHLRPASMEPLNTYGSAISSSVPDTPTGSGARASTVSKPEPNSPFVRPAPLWSPPRTSKPSFQEQEAAKAALLSQGRTPWASYVNPLLDALANTAQGRAVPSWDTELTPGEPLIASGPNSSQEFDTLRQHLADPHVEGYRLDVYLDSEGNPTVGIGHKVLPGDHLGVGDRISAPQVDAFFNRDGAAALAAAHQQAAEAGISDPAFISALASVNFQAGSNWRKTFPTTWKYIVAGRYEEAARELGRDEWARETPSRVAAFQAALRALPPKTNP